MSPVNVEVPEKIRGCRIVGSARFQVVDLRWEPVLELKKTEEPSSRARRLGVRIRRRWAARVHGGQRNVQRRYIPPHATMLLRAGHHARATVQHDNETPIQQSTVEMVPHALPAVAIGPSTTNNVAPKP